MPTAAPRPTTRLFRPPQPSAAHYGHRNDEQQGGREVPPLLSFGLFHTNFSFSLPCTTGHHQPLPTRAMVPATVPQCPRPSAAQRRASERRRRGQLRMLVSLMTAYGGLIHNLQ
jgi:hypothetical protein